MAKTIQLTKGSIIFFAGDKDVNIYILQAGSVALMSRDLGTGVTVAEQVKIGEFFGVKSALAHMPSLVTATAVEDSVVVQMSISEFEKFFGSKQEITVKMLRVFSKSLRDIHKKTEVFLKGNVVSISPEIGMATVAQAFYNDGKFVTCCGVIDKVFAINPNPSNKSQLDKLRADADGRARREPQVTVLPSDALSSSSGMSTSQFDLPVFQRFTKVYKQGEVIVSEFEPGESFYLIKQGEVQITKCIKDTNKSLDILGPGTFFGEMAILDSSQRSASCIARTEVSCLEFNKANFKSLVLSNTQIVMNLLKIFCKRIYDQNRQFKILLIKDMPARICDIFIMLDELQGNPTDGHRRDDDNYKRVFNITANDIASWAAIPIDEAKDELKKLVNKGKIEIFDNQIKVANIHDIRRTVDGYYVKLAAEKEHLNTSTKS